MEGEEAMSKNHIIIDSYSNLRHAGVDNWPDKEKRLNRLWERAAYGDDAERAAAREAIRREDPAIAAAKGEA